jgi:hypothetical protein
MSMFKLKIQQCVLSVNETDLRIILTTMVLIGVVHPDFAVFAGYTPCMLNCIHAAYMCGTLVNNLVSVSLFT